MLSSRSPIKVEDQLSLHMRGPQLHCQREIRGSHARQSVGEGRCESHALASVFTKATPKLNVNKASANQLADFENTNASKGRCQIKQRAVACMR